MARTISLSDGSLEVRVSLSGGALVDAACGGVPFLRPYVGDPAIAFDIARAASFPMVPFANRIAGNAFTFGGREYRLRANTSGDPLALHGDAWLAEWWADAVSASRATLSFEHAATEGEPFAYRIQQTVAVGGGVLSLDLSVENRGAVAMPFGIGHHPFLPLTPQTTLRAPARAWHPEMPGHLPGPETARPAELDFDDLRALPRRWINSGFEGWNGRATVTWPERRLALHIDADPLFTRYFLFMTDRSFEPGFADDWFCFEPMGHSADGHHLPDLGGLRVLAPLQRLSGILRFRPERLSAA